MLPARRLLLVAGLLSIALGSFNLGHELHSGNVDVIYVVVGGLVALVWLVSLYFAYIGSRVAIFLAGLIAFVEFTVIAAATLSPLPETSTSPRSTRGSPSRPC